MVRTSIPLCFCLLATCGPAQEAAGIPACEAMITTASGLQYGVLRKGREEAGPGPRDVVVVHYTGWLLTGKQFDSSRDRGQPARFSVDGVVKGWTEGLQLMTPGARFKMIVPPQLGYGSANRGPIPPDSTLVFDVELLQVVRLPKFVAADQQAQKTTESGLKYEVKKVGTGAMAGPQDGVKFRFALFSKEGELRTCSEREDHYLSGSCDTMPFPFLKELVGMMKVGDVFRCEVPAALASGERPLAGLPAGAETVWEIELLGTTKMPAFQASDPKKMTTTDSGLQYEVIAEGAGKRPSATSRVLAHYSGWLTDGTIFDSSHMRGEPMEFGLNQVIRGWTEGLQLMKEGAVYQFVIPPELAYGSQGSGDRIGPNATLVFRVELIEVK